MQFSITFKNVDGLMCGKFIEPDSDIGLEDLENIKLTKNIKNIPIKLVTIDDYCQMDVYIKLTDVEIIKQIKQFKNNYYINVYVYNNYLNKYLNKYFKIIYNRGIWSILTFKFNSIKEIYIGWKIDTDLLLRDWIKLGCPEKIGDY